MGSLLYGDVSVMFPVRDWNQYSFHLHYLLALEIPNCATPYFFLRPLKSDMHRYYYLRPRHSNKFKNPYLGNWNDSDTSDTINVMKLLF